MCDYDEYEMEKLLKEINEDVMEIDNLSHKLDTVFYYADLIEEIKLLLRNYDNNFYSIIDVCEKLPDDYGFLKGILFCSSFSAFEGFIHDFFRLIISNNNYKDKIILKLQNIDEETKKRLKISKDCETIEKLIKKIDRLTKNNPQFGADFLNYFIDCKVDLIFDSNKLYRFLKIRNKYIHQNGGDKITHDDFFDLKEILLSSTNIFVTKILETIQFPNFDD